MCGFMINVILPSSDPSAISYLQRKLDKDHNIFLVVDSVRGGEGATICFTRLSAQVYNQMSDFEAIAELVPQILHEFKQDM